MKVFCEYIENPAGVDCVRPRFSWRQTKEKGTQKSYRIVVGKEKDLTDEKSVIWDSKEVQSDKTTNIIYEGKELESVTDYYYQVTVTDADGQSETSEVQHMITGLIDHSLWEADWLGIPGMDFEAPMCRTDLDIPEKFQRAYAFVLTPNYYVLTVNGKKVTDTVLNNANTDPSKTLPYQMFEITENLEKGLNTLGVYLGKGWIGLPLTTAGDFDSIYKMSVQILTIGENGEKTWHRPGLGKWFFTQKGPVVYDSIYNGEVYDARKEIPHWDQPDHDHYKSDIVWNRMVETEPETGEICAQMLEDIRVVERFKPVAVYALEDGSYTFDMGKNIAGWVSLKVKGKKGQKFILSYAETEFPDHRVNKLSVRGAKAEDAYILKGEQEEIFEPEFTFHGFQFVNIQGFEQAPEADAVTGCMVQSDIPHTATFESSEPLLNKLYEVVCRTEETNRHSIPTDCPQRDERLGWTNDMSVRNECALYSYDLVKLYTKWMRDIRDTQGKVSGVLSDTAPHRRYGAIPMDPIAITPVNLPWNVFCFYGDKKILEDNYDMNVRWLSYLERNSEDGVVYFSHMGDWAGPMAGTCALVGEGTGGGAVSTITPTILVGTASFAYMCQLMAKTARVLEKDKDAEIFTEKAEKIKKSFLDRFYNREKKYFGKNSQGANAMAVFMGMAPEEDVPEIMKNIVEDIVEKNDIHLTTGNLCSRYILEILFKNGYADVAYDILTQTTYPSWGYMLEKGATTIWERWEEINEADTILADMASRNHPMYGAFAICFHKYLAGIQPDESTPGFRKVRICPYIPKKLDHVNASMDTVSGKISVDWKKADDVFELKVTIPFNCTGKIEVPVKDGRRCAVKAENADEVRYCGREKDREVYEVPAGTYSFSVENI